MQTSTQTLKPIQNALEKRKLLTQALFQRPKSLSKLLPYDGFIVKDKIFQLKDGSLGAVFELRLLEHEPMTEVHVIKAVSKLKSLFSLPENCTLQILYDQSAYSEFDKKIDCIQNSYKKGHPVSDLLFKDKINRIKNSCRIFGDKTPLNRKTYLSVRYHPSQKIKNEFKNYLKREEATLYFEMTSFVKELFAFKHILKNLQLNSEITLTQLNAEELLDFLRKFFNPKTYYKRSFAKYNPELPLSEQIIYNSPVLDYRGIEREKIKTRTLSLKTSPLYAYPGGMAYFVGIDFPFKLSLNFSFPSKAKVKHFFDFKEFFLENTPTARLNITHI